MRFLQPVLAAAVLAATPVSADDFRPLWKACKSAEKAEQLAVCRKQWDALEEIADPDDRKYWAARSRIEARILRMAKRVKGADDAEVCDYAERAMVTAEKAMSAEAITAPNSGLILKVYSCRETYPMPEWGFKFFN
jgi:hypothetical protein